MKENYDNLNQVLNLGMLCVKYLVNTAEDM